VWSARRRDWAPRRVIVPPTAVVATMPLAATLEQHLDRSHSLFGLGWVEIYSVFSAAAWRLVVMQLAVLRPRPPLGCPTARRLRAALAGHRSRRPGSASRCVLSGLTERRLNQREGTCDREADDHHERLVDGVMQGLGGPDEDRRGGFERGGWALPLFDNEAETFLAEVYQRADAFLFGRRTYEIFAGYWE
jgi:hypothetical protein